MLSVSAQAPTAAGRRQSALTPVVEDDERDNDIDRTERPEFLMNETDDRLFLTETSNISADNDASIGRPKSSSTSIKVNDNDVDDDDDVAASHERDERLNSDGEHFDDAFSDSGSDHSDCEPTEEDYETDLEFDEESKSCFLLENAVVIS